MFSRIADCFKFCTRKSSFSANEFWSPSLPVESWAAGTIRGPTLFNEEWSSPPGFLVQSLAEFLKRAHRWSVEGRSLRQLNKQWALQLNRHVVAVRPHESRGDLASAALSLVKFPWLTTLDLSPFIAKADQSQVVEVMRVISSLPHLSQVELSSDALQKLEDGDLRTLSGYDCVLSPSTLWYRPDVDKLSKLSVRRMRFAGSREDIHQMFQKLPSLEHLETSIGRELEDCQLVRALNSLESVTLILYWWNMHSAVYSLATVTNLVSLISDLKVDFVILAELPLLRTLQMPTDSAAVSSDAFPAVLERLTSLNLCTVGASSDIELTKFTKNPINLRSLALSRFRLKDLGVFDGLSQLTSLRLSGRALDAGIGFLTFLRSLKRLDLLYPRSGNAIWPVWLQWGQTLDHSVLPCLSDLTIELGIKHRLCMRVVGKLTKLQVFGLRLKHPGNYHPDEVFPELEKLPDLRMLSLESLDCANLKPEHYQELWRRLECLRIGGLFKKPGIPKKLHSKIRNLAPHLRVELHVVTEYPWPLERDLQLDDGSIA